MQNLPQHIVLIPDGNRRWAKKKRLASFMGHREGAKVLERVLSTSLGLGIPCLTFWGTSLDNVIKRNAKEVNFLFDIFESYFKKLAKSKEIHKNHVRVDVLGQRNKLFPDRVKKPIREDIEKTKIYNKHQLTLLMAYSGIDEMTNAIQKIAKIKNKKPEIKIDKNLIKKNLWTKDLPVVDLVIRTGGEPHWSSGMMMWDVADAQLYFTKTLLPDFSVEEFKKAVNQYSMTERRKGA